MANCAGNCAHDLTDASCGYLPSMYLCYCKSGCRPDFGGGAIQDWIRPGRKTFNMFSPHSGFVNSKSGSVSIF